MTTEVLDRRAAIEAAFEATEAAEPEKVEAVAPIEAPPAAPADEPNQTEAAIADAPTAETASEVIETDAKPLPGLEKPPQAWKAPLKAKWNTLDPEVRGEVLRRERETTKVLNESAQARNLATEFNQAVQPYMARIRANGTSPTGAVQALLNADHILSSAPPLQRAQFMAKLISDYGINLEQLDLALSGRPQADPVESKVEQLLNQRLMPFQQMFQQQEQQRQQAMAAESQQLTQTIDGMYNNPKFPYFEQVREAMADIIELSANQGRNISIETAYNRAIAVDPELSQQVAQRTTEQMQAAQAAKLNGKAQKALQASVSVGGAPSGSVAGKTDSGNRRAVIEAAFAAASSR